MSIDSMTDRPRRRTLKEHPDYRSASLQVTSYFLNAIARKADPTIQESVIVPQWEQIEAEISNPTINANLRKMKSVLERGMDLCITTNPSSQPFKLGLKTTDTIFGTEELLTYFSVGMLGIHNPKIESFAQLPEHMPTLRAFYGRLYQNVIPSKKGASQSNKRSSFLEKLGPPQLIEIMLRKPEILHVNEVRL